MSRLPLLVAVVFLLRNGMSFIAGLDATGLVVLHGLSVKIKASFVGAGLLIAKWPPLSSVHVTEDTLTLVDKVWTERVGVLAHFLCAVTVKVANNNVAGHNVLDSGHIETMGIHVTGVTALLGVVDVEVGSIGVGASTSVNSFVGLLESTGVIVFRSMLEEPGDRIGHHWLRLEGHSSRVLAQTSLVLLVLIDQALVSGETGHMETQALGDDSVAMVAIHPDTLDRDVGGADGTLARVPLRATGVAHVTGPGPLVSITADGQPGQTDCVGLLHDHEEVLWCCLMSTILSRGDGERLGAVVIDMAIGISFVLANAVTTFIPNSKMRNTSSGVWCNAGEEADADLLVRVLGLVAQRVRNGPGSDCQSGSVDDGVDRHCSNDIEKKMRGI
ncbi:uncharacterized protein N7473_001310 [Penicillium subrubescens]|uniref:uncharacterized protein n=1 Tax=Penicillium subrubescens TaxID=1316194 RepID=UPI002545013F|nr:uncharacterized protein N7473_001310 [Penicillium subrubescens]KAJ5912007.1 hypothetical protein N7473_001310 [Penicillium subrubescens]